MCHYAHGPTVCSTARESSHGRIERLLRSRDVLSNGCWAARAMRVWLSMIMPTLLRAQTEAPGFWHRRKHLAYYSGPGGYCTAIETPPSPTTHTIDYLSGAAIQCASMKTGFKFPVLKAS